MVQIRSRNDTVLPGGERRHGKAAGLDRTHQRGSGKGMKAWETPSSTVDSAANATCYNLIESDYLPAPSTSTAMSLNHQRLTATDEHKKIRFPAHARTVLREIYQTSTQQAHVCCAKRVLATSPATAPATAPATTPASSVHAASAPLAFSVHTWPTTSFAAARSSTFSSSASSDHFTAASMDWSAACSWDKCSSDRRCCSAAFLYRVERSSSSLE